MAPAVTVLALVVGLYAVGTLVYVAASFALSWSHVERRGLLASLREALLECLWATLTQPLLPLYYFVGRRLAPGDGRPVVCVHGYFQNRVDFLYLARVLRRRGVGPVYGFNYAWLLDLPTLGERLGRFVARVREETGADQVDLICHSMGGLVAAEYLANQSGTETVRRCVTIATPHRGTRYRGPILGRAHAALRRGHALDERMAVPLLSLYSTHDNVVFPPSASELLAPAQNASVGGQGHLAILFAAPTADAVVRFLTETED